MICRLCVYCTCIIDKNAVVVKQKIISTVTRKLLFLIPLSFHAVEITSAQVEFTPSHKHAILLPAF